MIVDNFPLIVGGILAIAALPVIATLVGFTSMLLGGIGLLAPLLPFLLKAMLAAAAIILAVKAGKWLWKKTKQGWKWAGARISGGDASFEMDKMLDDKLRDAGMDKAGTSTKIRGSAKRNMGPNRGLTAEQEKIFQEVEAERARINALEKERNKEIGPIEKEIKNLTKTPGYFNREGVLGTKQLNEAGEAKKAELQEKKKQIVDQYGEVIRTGGKFSLPSKTEEPKKEDTKLDKASGLEQQAAQLKKDTSLQMEKTVPSKGIDRELTGEGQVEFLNFDGAGEAQDQGGIAADASTGGSASPNFSSVDSNVNTLVSKSLYNMWV